jgi:small GTP-binding protein
VERSNSNWYALTPLSEQWADRESRGANNPEPGSPVSGPQEPLWDYDRLKLDLADIIRSIRHLAERRKDQWGSGECRRLQSRLAEDRFNLVVLGQFSRGKSSLMNAILGVERLPTGVLPLTSVITTVSYGDRERVLIQRRGSTLPEEVALSQLRQYVTQEENPGNEQQVILAAVQLPIELLRLGFYFIDTPGVGSAVAENTATTTEFLPEADAVIFITSVESALSGAELQFLQHVRKHVRKIFVVLNKRDLISPEQEKAVIAFVQERLRELFGDHAPPVFPVSARDGLEGKEKGDRDKLDHSGIPELETALVEFLKTGKTRELLLRTANRGGAVLEQQESDFRLSETLAADRAKLDAYYRDQDRRLNELNTEVERTVGALRDRLGHELPRHFEAELDVAIAELRTAMVSRIDEPCVPSRRMPGSPNDIHDANVRAACQEMLTAWLTERQEVIQNVIRHLIADDIGRLDERVGELVRAGHAGSLANRGAAPSLLHLILDISVMFRRLQLPPGDLPLPWFPSLISRIPPVRAAVRRRFVRRLDALLCASRDEIIVALRRAGEDWTDRAGRKITDEVASVAAHQRETLHNKGTPQEASNLERLRERLRHVIDTLCGPGASSEPFDSQQPGHVPRSNLRARCAICVRAEKALLEFMRHTQYELSVSESDRATHAEQGGFCALHTWQYEAIASPQGICSAYPPLLFELTRRLRSLLPHSHSSSSLSDGLQQLLPRPTSCPVCQLIDAEERNAATDVLRRVSSDTGNGPNAFPPLCLRHLGTVLRLEPPVEIGDLLVEEQARVLDRLGQDMQRFSLKHQALRQRLASEGEQRAYESGLSRLVGLRNIAAPWRVD